MVKIENEQEEREEEEDAASPLALPLSKRKRKGDKARGPSCQAPVCFRVRLLVRISRNLQPRVWRRSRARAGSSLGWLRRGRMVG